MNLQDLSLWAKKTKDDPGIRQILKKENDINICLSLLREIEKRAKMIVDNTHRNEDLLNSILEYVEHLKERGLVYVEPIPPPPPKVYPELSPDLVKDAPKDKPFFSFEKKSDTIL